MLDLDNLGKVLLDGGDCAGERYMFFTRIALNLNFSLLVE